MRLLFVVMTVMFFVSCSFQNGDVVGNDNKFEVKDSAVQDDESNDTETPDDSKPTDEDTIVLDEEPDTQSDNEIDDEMADEDEDTEIEDNSGNDEDLTVIDKVTIATYNSYRFFDTVCDSGYCGSSDYEVQFSETEYNEKVKDMAAALKKIDADIILLQEIEKKICVEDLQEELNGMYSAIYIGETGGSASVDVAVMTKGKIVDTNKHLASIPHPDGGTTTFARAFLEVQIELGTRKIIVFAAHFKSKSNDDPDRRLAEARAALQILEDTADANSDALIVMGGDLNDTPDSLPIGTLEDSSELTRVASDISDDATYYYQSPIAIDHLFVSLEGSGSYVPGSASVVKDSPSWYSLMSSDHAAVKADFEF